MTSPRLTSPLAALLPAFLSLAVTCGCGGPSETGSGGTSTGGTSTAGTAGTGGTGTTGTGGSAGATGSTSSNGVTEQDILSTKLVLDLGALTGSATLEVQPATDATSVSLEVAGLGLTDVKLDGAATAYDLTNGVMTIGVAGSARPVTIDVAYDFAAKMPTDFDGWMPKSGVTFLWPYFCDNLFPCNSKPDDGAVFEMEVTGYDPTLTAVFPTTTTGDAPSYMPAVAVGDYVELDLGKTAAGTAVSAWHFPGQEIDAQMGTAHLVAVIDFYETTYGPYSFGPKTGSVSADWGPGAYGGMEHHPFVHVGKDDFANEEVHAHEAAHGWYGDGVRIACWEDFVLSEGTVTYMAAHALESVGGPNVWPEYVTYLDDICSGADINTIALPDTCNEIDLLTDDLWSNVPYMKGACFLEDVADLIGPAKLDEALAEMYGAHVGGAAKMVDLIATIESKATADEKAKIDGFVTEWLLTVACPADYATRCGAHQ